MSRFAAAVVAAALFVPGAALAQDGGWEIREAIMMHDTLHPEKDDRESGVNLETEVISPRIDALEFLGRPRLHASASVNTDGDTNFAAIGFVWRKQWSERWTGELQFGYAVHDGELDSADPVLQETRLQLGSRDLFRTALGADYKVSENWSIGLQWVHLSHGGILGDGRNQGLDTAGVRFTRRFGN